jgi:ABC-type Fe3+ transport system permease subunit
MQSISIWQGLIVIFFIVALGIPIARILTRIGYSKWWTIVYFIPFVNIIGIWILAYSRWPAVDRARI